MNDILFSEFVWTSFLILSILFSILNSTLIICLLNYFKQNSIKENVSKKYPDISATSVSEVTGIPRATCIRKLEWLSKAKFVRKDPLSKRYNLINEGDNNDGYLTHPLTNVQGTAGQFAEFSSIVYRAVLR